MRYLLDTNVVSDLVRQLQGPVAQRIRQIGEASVCTSIIVAAELRFGAEKKGSERLTDQVEAVLGVLDLLPWRPPRTRCTEPSARVSNGWASRSAAMTCSSPRRQLPSATLW